MRLEFTILGEARAQPRGHPHAFLPKGGKKLRDEAVNILEFYGPAQSIPPDESQKILQALALKTRTAIFDPPVSKDWKNLLRWHLLPKAQDPLWPGPVAIQATFYFPLPKSRPKWLHEVLAQRGRLPHLIQADTEQLIKPVKDAARGILWGDDSQVYHDDVSKWYGSPPRVELVVELEGMPERPARAVKAAAAVGGLFSPSSCGEPRFITKENAEGGTGDGGSGNGRPGPPLP